jgi:type VI secretion system protein VasD
MPTRLPSPLDRLLPCAALLLLLAGCGSTGKKLGEGFGNMGDKALETIGFKKPDLPKPPELPESAKPPRPMRLQVAASRSLNLDPDGNPLALVVRVYKLRAPSAFLNAPLGSFGDPAREKQALGEDLLDVKELILAPGQRRELNEKWAREAGFVGVVGLFLHPAPGRWRHAFEVAELSGPMAFSVGAHACALSVGTGTPVGVSPSSQRLRPAECDPAGSLLDRPAFPPPAPSVQPETHP